MSKKWGVRTAIAVDAPLLATLDAGVTNDPRDESYFSRYCTAGPSPRETASNHALVAECEQQILGYLIYSRVLDSAEIINIIVAPEVRGQGIGRTLLLGAEKTMCAAGLRRCQLEVRQSNTAAIALYASEGFEEDGRRRAYYPVSGGGREDALLMSKEL